MRKLVAHKREDHVAVAVTDLAPGEEVEVAVLEGGSPLRVFICEPIPLGHKVALRDIGEGDIVREYGEAIGRANRPILAGAHVHTHNLRSLRWDFGRKV